MPMNRHFTSANPQDWPGTDQLGVLVTVASLALAIVYADESYDATDALAGAIVLGFGVVYRPRLRPESRPVDSTVVRSQLLLATFLLGVIVCVGASSLVLGVVNDPAIPFPWPEPLPNTPDTRARLERTDLGVTLGAVLLSGVAAALWCQNALLKQVADPMEG